MPSLTSASEGNTTTITEGGAYQGENSDETLVIQAATNLIIKGNKGKKHYVISSTVASNITITIVDFKSEGDVLDLSELSSSCL
jgi:hypothetical protein